MTNNLEDALEFLRGVKFSGNHCILASMTVRDFLRQIGFKAEVKSVELAIEATAFESNMPLYTLGVGCNKLWNQPYTGKDWDGHLVVATPGYIIDMTYYQMRRLAWQWIEDVAIVPRNDKLASVQMDNGQTLPVIAQIEEEVEEHNYKYTAKWLSYSNNKGWLTAPDYKIVSKRRGLTEELIETWKKKKPK
jgi:hypothetical protein